jgi:hypothetical protein
MALLRDTKARAKRIDLAYFKKSHPFRRWKRILSILLPAAGGVWLAAMAGARDERIYTSGGLAARHAMLEKNCIACHTSGWGGRYLDPSGWQERLDTACLSCHDGPVHHANAVDQVRGPKGRESASRCSTCHVEHEGAHKLAQVADRHCVTCHGDLKTSSGEPSFERRIDAFWKGHPEFDLLAQKAKDPTVVKFNHAVHLKPDSAPKRDKLQEDLKRLAGRPGIDAAGLGCAFCHRGEGAGAYMAPIHYESHCIDCHALKLEGQPVPHEAPNVVRDFLRSRLAVKGKGGEDLAVQVIEVESPIYTSDTVNCGKCHQVKDADDPLVAPPAVVRTGLRPGPAGNDGAPRRWFGQAFFNHDTHRTLRCLECHGGAETSKDTADLLMPAKAACLRCHAPSPAGGVASACSTCHTYHDKTRQRPADGRLNIGEVLK